MDVSRLCQLLDLKALSKNELERLKSVASGINEISLLAFELAQNSVFANAKNIEIYIFETGVTTQLEVFDDGVGIPKEHLQKAVELGFSTKSGGKNGLGLSLVSVAARLTGGSFEIKSESGTTRAAATFIKSSKYCLPIGDMPSTVMSLVSALADDARLYFRHICGDFTVCFDTFEAKKQLSGIPIASALGQSIIKEYLALQYEIINNNIF